MPGVAKGFIVLFVPGPTASLWSILVQVFPKETEEEEDGEEELAVVVFVLPEEDVAPAAAAAAAAASASAAFLPAFGPRFFLGVGIGVGGVSMIVSRTGELTLNP